MANLLKKKVVLEKVRIRSSVFIAFVCIVFFAGIAGCSLGEKRMNQQLRTAPLMRGTLWWVRGDNMEHQWQKSDFAEEIKLHRKIGFDILWIFNTPKLMADAIENQQKGIDRDVIEMIFEIADEHNMLVIVDLPNAGWYGKSSKEDMIEITHRYISQFYKRYAEHKSFYGWYLNYEINPLKPADVNESKFWRYVWKEIVAECHKVTPERVVTISPFFLLDKEELRGFTYLEPKVYEQWWSVTLAETKIDILMLQDSGEHLGFYTLEQREPFFVAFRRACKKAGTEFWVNVETGEEDINNWYEYFHNQFNRKTPHEGWRFTPIERLEKKLHLAAKYGEGIINWGYYPYMTPNPIHGIKLEGQLQAYQDYKAYYKRIIKSPECAPLMVK